MAEVFAAPRLSDVERLTLLGIYAPYLLMPLALLWRATSRTVLFPRNGKGVSDKRLRAD